MKQAIALFWLAVLFFSSCSLMTSNINNGKTNDIINAKLSPNMTSNTNSGNENDSKYESVHLDVKIFQTLNKNEALASRREIGHYGDEVLIVSSEEVFYDGKVMEGSFILLGTYYRRGQTLPVFIRSSHKDLEVYQLLYKLYEQGELDEIIGLYEKGGPDKLRELYERGELDEDIIKTLDKLQDALE